MYDRQVEVGVKDGDLDVRADGVMAKDLACYSDVSRTSGDGRRRSLSLEGQKGRKVVRVGRYSSIAK